MKILLVGNYPHDRQQSMQRFAALMERELRRRQIDVELISPRPFLGKLRPAAHGIGKWLGYFDKFVLFPRRLRKESGKLTAESGNLVVHICDHSSAPYTRCLQQVPHLVTCHDLLAIRSALGEVAQNRTKWSGKKYQEMILGGLNRAQHVVCVSQATRADLLRISSLSADQISVVHNGLNYPYSPMPREEVAERVAALLQKLTAENGKLRDDPLTDRPLQIANWNSAFGTRHPHTFLLHVGGNQWYKNRLGVLKIYRELVRENSTAPSLVMVGKNFTPAMQSFIGDNNLADRITEIVEAEPEDLRALYSMAELLLFPSLAEGFGWPIVEAQACGCRVVTSDRAPMTEVGGPAAFYVAPEDLVAAAQIVRDALNEDAEERRTRIKRGLANAATFSTDRMVEGYVEVYQKLKAEI